MAEELRRHWAPVFTRGTVDARARGELLHELTRKIDHTKVLPLSIDMLGRVIEKGNFRAAGPDGIVGWAWARLKFRVTRTLWRCAEKLAQGELPPASLNRAFLVWVPRKAFTIEAKGVAAKPSDLRPISLKDASSKFLRKLLPAALASALPARASASQRGFVAGRLPMANLLELDTAARKVALRFPRGCIVSTDFATAFPATDQSWILRVLAHAGFASELICLARASLQDAVFLTEALDVLFPVSSGVGQGCTAASTLFVIAAEPILQAVGSLLEHAKDELVVAFADDLAFTLHSTYKLLALGDILELVREATCLALQPHKSQVIPIGHDVQHPKDVVCDECLRG